MKGVILAGGKGTRMAPATLVTNKHLLPIYSEAGAVPMLFYPIHTLVSSGITDILIVSSREHCGHIIENLSDGFQFGANFSYKIQDHNRVVPGIASALKLAENFCDDETFAVVLGDNFFEDSFDSEFGQFAELDGECSMMSGLGPEPFGWGEIATAGIFLKQVDDPERFGVAFEDDEGRVTIEEKPKEPKSNWAVTGLYLYTPHVYEVAAKLKPSNRGELEITDINNYYCEHGAMRLNYINGFWSDMGVPSSMLRTEEFIRETNYRI